MPSSSLLLNKRRTFMHLPVVPHTSPSPSSCLLLFTGAPGQSAQRASWPPSPLGVQMGCTAASSDAASSPSRSRDDVAAPDVTTKEGETVGEGRGAIGGTEGTEDALVTGDADGTRIGMEARER